MSTVPPRPDIGPGERQPGPAPATWKAIEALPVGLIALGATAIIGAILAVVFPAQEAVGGRTLRESPGFFTFANMAQELAILCSVALWVRFVNKGSLASLGLPPRRPWTDIGIGVMAGVAVVFGAGIVLEIVRSIVDALVGHHVSNPEQVPSDVRGAYLAVSGVVVVGLAPLAEEAFFRGFLYKGLRR